MKVIVSALTRNLPLVMSNLLGMLHFEPGPRIQKRIFFGLVVF